MRQRDDHRQAVAGRALPEGGTALTPARLRVMTVAAGVGIANIYYNQPLLEQMAASVHAGEPVVGLVPTLTQVGYALGMLLLVPLGDMLQRRRLALAFAALVAAMCAGVAASASAGALLAFSFLLGLVNMGPQLLIPFAAQLSSAARRGRVVGTLLSGILLGVLLSRTVAGFVGAAFGWRVMFALAAVVQAALVAALARVLPATAPSYRGSYAGLLGSVWTLLRGQPVLREACVFGATLFGAFMVFWSSLIHLVTAPPFGLGPRTVGLYGILGAGAALLSPVVGRAADRGGARRVAGGMIVLAMGSFGIFWYGRASLAWIGVGVLTMDLGVQLAHVGNQGRILKLAPGAHSRVQTAYMTCYFAGGGAGAALGTWAWSHGGWAGVCLAAEALLAVALLRWLGPSPKAGP